MNIIFFGSGHYAPIVLRSIIGEPTFKVNFVVTGDLNEKGPAQLTASLSREKKLPLFSWTNADQDLELINIIKIQKPDFLLVADFGHRKKPIPAELLAIPRFGAVNIHPSLLPKYRGTSPIQTAIINGDKETGVSLILMDDKFDHGPLLAQATFPLEPTATSPELYEKLFEFGARMLSQSLHLLASPVDQRAAGRNPLGTVSYEVPSAAPVDGRKKVDAGEGEPEATDSNKTVYFCPPLTQDESETTYTKMLKKEMGRIDWTKTPAEIERAVRAYTGWPGSWTTFHELLSWKDLKSQIANVKSEKKIKILKTHLSGNNQLVIDQLQIEGKKPIGWEEFGRGYLK